MIVDTSAFYAVLKAEDDGDRFLAALTQVNRRPLISAATLIEAHVVAQRMQVETLENELAALLADCNCLVVPVDAALAQIAIEAHRQFGRGSGHPARLNFGDCFSYALAKQRAAPLLFKGQGFARTDVASVL